MLCLLLIINKYQASIIDICLGLNIDICLGLNVDTHVEHLTLTFFICSIRQNWIHKTFKKQVNMIKLYVIRKALKENHGIYPIWGKEKGLIQDLMVSSFCCFNILTIILSLCY